MSEEKLYIDDGELVYYINENEFIACDEIPMPMLEGIKHLQQKVEQLENIRKEAIDYINHATIGADSNPIEDSWLYNLYETRHILNKGSESNV